MPLKPIEQFEFGGVDTRSNPLNMPYNRLLRCVNWVPKQDGHLELRWGYSTVSASTITASTITALIPYTLWSGTKYVIRFQGTTPYQVAVSDGTVTSPTVRGMAFSSSAKGSYFNFNNKLYYGNGTDQKWFDGTTWRDNGLRALTDSEVSGIGITQGVREISSSEASTISISAAAGGTFSATTLTGILFYVAFFDTSNNELGPATISVGSGRVTNTVNQKFSFTNLPNLSSANANWVKLMARTADAGGVANFCTNTSTAVTDFNQSGTTATVTAASHGLSSGDIVVISGVGSSKDGVYKVASAATNTFTVTMPTSVTTDIVPSSATVKRIVSVANATTSVDVTSPSQDSSIIVNDSNRGLPASTIGGSNPGYQFYASIYNQNGGGHVGNRTAIGQRQNPSTRVNIKFSNLPDLSSSDTEWALVIGRTGDGAQIPYVCDDSDGNWLVSNPAQSSLFTGNFGGIDGNFELPVRNTVIPAACDKFAVVGDYVYAADSSSPTIRRSGSVLASKVGTFMGLPEQSWASNDIDTFPTNEVPTALAEVDLETWVATVNDCAILSDAAGVMMWRGPYTVGCAGKRAFIKTDHGFFWVTGDKQLATFINGLPIAISDEYEKGELALIGDSQLSSVECVYERDAANGKDEIRIEGQKADGTPHTVIHDFLLKDDRSPFGAGYGSEYTGALATAFTVAKVRDSNGKRQIWAGATNGQIYQLYSGANDAGTEYDADAIGLPNVGSVRVDIPYLDWYGDQNVTVSVCQNLKASTATAAEFGFTPIKGEVAPSFDNMYRFRAKLDIPEATKLYVRFQLTSHSADGDLSLSTIPHVPLETYGRIYEVIPHLGQERPA